mmetsp:Transcript_135052/g.269498  ORF Transcript_135052/g.269498 Transcript_135052/m.269498 type:complete len:799 (-) Transcript_135052:316-2712(-)
MQWSRPLQRQHFANSAPTSYVAGSPQQQQQQHHQGVQSFLPPPISNNKGCEDACSNIQIVLPGPVQNQHPLAVGHRGSQLPHCGPLDGVRAPPSQHIGGPSCLFQPAQPSHCSGVATAAAMIDRPHEEWQTGTVSHSRRLGRSATTPQRSAVTPQRTAAYDLSPRDSQPSSSRFAISSPRYLASTAQTTRTSSPRRSPLRSPLRSPQASSAGNLGVWVHGISSSAAVAAAASAAGRGSPMQSSMTAIGTPKDGSSTINDAGGESPLRSLKTSSVAVLDLLTGTGPFSPPAGIKSAGAVVCDALDSTVAGSSRCASPDLRQSRGRNSMTAASRRHSDMGSPTFPAERSSSADHGKIFGTTSLRTLVCRPSKNESMSYSGPAAEASRPQQHLEDRIRHFRQILERHLVEHLQQQPLPPSAATGVPPIVRPATMEPPSQQDQPETPSMPARCAAWQGGPLLVNSPFDRSQANSPCHDPKSNEGSSLANCRSSSCSHDGPRCATQKLLDAATAECAAEEVVEKGGQERQFPCLLKRSGQERQMRRSSPAPDGHGVKPPNSARSASRHSPRRSFSPRHDRGPFEMSLQALRSVVQIFLDPLQDPANASATAEELLFHDLPSENVQALNITVLQDQNSRSAFLAKLQDDGGKISRVRIAWHLAGGAAAAAAIETRGIRCDDGHCACGRYGRGGYVATSAAKANAYADSDGAGGWRHLFLVMALPEEDVVRGERGFRPPCTAADLPSHPTEYCFVDEARLHCVCRMDYQWAPTGRRPKVATSGGHTRAWRKELQGCGSSGLINER